MKRVDFIDLCERAYTIDGSRTDWLETLTEAALRVARRQTQSGALACTITRNTITGALRVRHGVARGIDVPGGMRAGIARFQRQLDRLDARHSGALCPIAPVSCRASELAAFFGVSLHCLNLRELAAPGFDDAWVVLGTTASGGTLLVFPLDERDDALAFEEDDSWQRFSAHLASAAQLRDLVHEVGSWRDPKSLPAAVPADQEERQTLWTRLLEGRLIIVARDLRGDGLTFLLHVAPPSDPDPPRRLTRRERAVVDMAARGLDNITIADALGVSMPTVASHLSSGLHRMQIPNRSQLIVLYHRLAERARAAA